MKLTMTRVLTPLAALAFAFSAQAALPANEGFEGDELDSNWTFVKNGADGAGDASAITAYGTDDKPADTLAGDGKCGLPDGFTTDGNNYLKLSTEDGTLFRKVNGGESMDVGAGLYLDTVVQFTVTDSSDRPTPTSEDKFIVWLEADSANNSTNLCVWGGYLEEAVSGFNLISNVYTLASDEVEIAPGSWHRLTVKAVAGLGLKYGADGSDCSVPGFQVYVDGNLMTDGSQSFADDNVKNSLDSDSLGIVNSYEFIPAMVSGGRLTQIGFSGEGKLDDVVITKSMPSIEPHDTVTIAWADEKVASITPKIGETELGTFTTSPATINVPGGATVTLTTEGIAAASGYNASYFAFGTDTTATGDGELTVAEDKKSLTLAFDAANKSSTLTLDIDYTLAYDVMVDWSDLSGVQDQVASVVINENTITDLSDGYYLLTGVKPGDTFTVTVNYTSESTLETVYSETSEPAGGLTRDGTTYTVPDSYQQSGEVTLTISLSAQASAAKVFKVGETEYTLDEIGDAIADSSAANPLKLLDNVTLESAATINDGVNAFIDLAGKTLTGAETADVFAIVGSLTITNSVAGEGGVITNGTDRAIASNVSGKFYIDGNATYTGAITKEDGNEDALIQISAGKFSENITDATFATGYGLENNALSGMYEYVAKTYKIVYNKNGGTGTDMSDTTFTVETAGKIADNAYTAPSGKKFAGWNTAADGSGAAYAVGADTPTVTAELDASTTLYAQWNNDTPEISPGETAEYDTLVAAETATNGLEVTIATDVATVLNSEEQAAYKAMFEPKITNVSGTYVVSMELTAVAAQTLQTQVDADVKAAAASLTSAAAADTEVTITATKGFYYGVKSGTTLGGMKSIGADTPATSTSITVTLPKGGDTANFYSIEVSPTAIPAEN